MQNMNNSSPTARDEANLPEFTPAEQRVLAMVHDHNLPGLKRALAALLRTPAKTTDPDALADLMDCCMLDAAEMGYLDIIKFLHQEAKLARVEPLDYPYGPEDTPLLYAAAAGATDVVKYLLQAGANPFALDETGVNLAQNAINSGNVELAKYLIEDCKMPWQGYTWEGLNALHLAVDSQQPAMFEYVLSLGALAYDQPTFCTEECRKNFPIARYIDSLAEAIATDWDPKAYNADEQIKIQSQQATELKNQYLEILAKYQRPAW
ncbi:MAG: ankyrin repeat domain-containing protein [Lentisphaerae bacterium]|nr:ankyrin repeat domain-containing protein [Lentisphaerota bacterium]